MAVRDASARPSGGLARARVLIARRIARIDDESREALSEAWRALWTSRLLVWIAGIYAILEFGYTPGYRVKPVVPGWSGFANLLVAPSAHWDAGWYLTVARHGYIGIRWEAFFPLYPLAVHVLGFIIQPLLVAGILVSVAAFGVVLYLLHRLTTLELGADGARVAVLALAFSPVAFFFSAAYAESLTLALTIGAIYAARRGRWAWAGVLGGLAAASRNTGGLVLLPLVLLYFRGPRSDRTDEPPAWRWVRHRPRPDVLWLALVPLGLIAYFAYLGIAHGDALGAIHAEKIGWNRSFQFLQGVPDAVTTVRHAVSQIFNGPDNTQVIALPYHQLVPTTRMAVENLVDFGFLLLALIGTVGVFRRLPLAYGAYCLALVVMAVSAPAPLRPLASLPRYVLLLFPIQMWLGAWAHERRRVGLLMGANAMALGLLAGVFATARWVA